MEVDELRDEIFAIQQKYGILNASFRDKATECSEVEDHLQEEIDILKTALTKVTGKNKELQGSLMISKNLAVDQIKEECEAKMASL